MTWRATAAVVAFCFMIAPRGMDAQTQTKAKDPYEEVTPEVRLASIRRAQVWMPTDVASKDIKTGPQDGNGFAPGAAITCTYIEKKQTGTPKFDCTIAPGDRIRVKYGYSNGEVYSEVAATRLLWALGFGADRVYPVKVTCEGCPADPMKKHLKESGTREVPSAVVERKMAGDEISEDEGWEWDELAFVDGTAGGAPLAHRDALKLLAVMIQHTDSKRQQQRLVCLDRAKGLEPQQDGNCQHPFMMIHDAGKTFGKASLTNEDRKSAVNFEAWSETPVWKEGAGCVGKISKSFSGSLENPVISEAGRQFLSDLLMRLTDAQIYDLFEVARFTQREPRHTTEDCVGVFKQKREEIATRRCN